MNHEQLNEALALWRQAYGVLRHPCRPAGSLLEAGDVRAVADWIRSGQASLPPALRPRAGQEKAFARMLCSFPSTSGNDRAFTLRSGRGRIGRRLRFRAGGQASLLKRLALGQVAAECGVVVTEDQFQDLCADAGSDADLNLVTYALELVRRMEFQSQGLAVYSLWLELDEQVRRRLSDALVREAEARLIGRLQTQSHPIPAS